MSPHPTALTGKISHFDKGPHDKRYADAIEPAIRAADLEPYRVDRDDVAVIPVETLHDEIKSVTLCLADITTRNPKVMYELGYAIASGKDVVLICETSHAEKFPFDIQHRGIIQYSLESASDFETLKKAVTRKLEALLKKQATTGSIAAASPLKTTEGLQASEVAALAFVMANVDSSDDRITTSVIKGDMQRIGYTPLAAQLALTRLSRMQFIAAGEDNDINGNTWVVYRTLPAGEDWLLENQDKLELRAAPPPPKKNRGSFAVITDDDVPF